MRSLVLVPLALASFDATAADLVYRGTLGAQPIHLVVAAYGDGEVHAIYAYDRHDTPIRVDGALHAQHLVLKEGATATLAFDRFDATAKRLEGAWRTSDGAKSLPITLEREAVVDRESDGEILQAASTRDHYFKTVVEGGQVTGVEVFRKKTHALVQKVALDAENRGIDNVSTGDFNFDGREDFAVFQASATGPNTTSLYVLRDKNTERFTLSAIEGVSLDFDAKNRLVYEHNQCCGGSRSEDATYRVVDDKLELIEKVCSEMDESGESKVVPCG